MPDLESNLSLADKYLQRFQVRTTGHFINGQWLATGLSGSKTEVFDNLSPINNRSLGKVALGAPEDIV